MASISFARPVPLLALLLPFLVLLLFPVPALSQQHFGGPGGGPGGGGPPPQPLHDVLMLVFDKDKNGKVTESEMTNTMGSLEMLLQEGGDGSGANPYLAMLKGAQAAAPDLFDLLDADYSKGLDKEELKWTTKFQKALKNGDARLVVRECFKMLDVGPEDGKISAEELRLAFAEDQQQESEEARLQTKAIGGDWDGGLSLTLSGIVDIFYAAFPLREDPADLKELVRRLLDKGYAAVKRTQQRTGSGGDEPPWSAAIRAMDEDGDGFVDRKEAGKAYAEAKKQFLEVSKTIQQMGPMMAMLGGGLGGMGEL